MTQKRTEKKRKKNTGKFAQGKFLLTFAVLLKNKVAKQKQTVL